MTNDEYRKSRGTHKPFNASEEQAKATWNEFIRKEKYHRKKPDATPEATSKK
jgi:deoxyribodipyrimidine photolyase